MSNFNIRINQILDNILVIESQCITIVAYWITVLPSEKKFFFYISKIIILYTRHKYCLNSSLDRDYFKKHRFTSRFFIKIFRRLVEKLKYIFESRYLKLVFRNWLLLCGFSNTVVFSENLKYL